MANSRVYLGFCFLIFKYLKLLINQTLFLYVQILIVAPRGEEWEVKNIIQDSF